MAVTGLNDDLKAHLRKLTIRATLWVVAVLAAIVSLTFGVALLLDRSHGAIPCFAVVLLSIANLLYINRAAQVETRETIPGPVALSSTRSCSFGEAVARLEGITSAEDRLSLSEEVRLFRTKRILTLRVVVYHAASFDKRAYDKARAGINRQANQKWDLSPWVSLSEAAKMMRINLICAEEMNDALRRLLSQNAEHNLRRAEGVIHVGLVGGQLLLPPLYGACDLADLRRYKSVLRFLEQTLLTE